MMAVLDDGLRHLRSVGVIDEVVADLGRRCRLAASDAGRPHYARTGPDLRLQFGKQRLGAGHGAGQAVADPDGERLRWRLAFLHDVEMRVEGRDLVDLGLGHTHLLGQRRKMAGREMPVLVLDEVQELDQEVAPAVGRAQQYPDFMQSTRLRPATLGSGPAPAATRAGVTRLVRGSMTFRHDFSPRPPCRTLTPRRLGPQSE